MENYCIIMAGGIGSRFWPLSKDHYPKQFLDILGTGKSFIRSTYERFSPVIPDENFLVVTNKAYKDLVLEQLPMLRADQVLCEPARRNTAPCIAYACYHIQSRCPNANIAVTPADHLVTNEREFERIIRLGFDFLGSHPQALMTIGIQPSRPETGYGIFLWTLEGIMKAFRTYLPEMVEVFEKGVYHFGTPEEQDFINDHFVECPNISIDYGVMEKSPDTYTIPADFGWSDIGTWGSLFTHAQKDPQGNALRGKVVSIDNKNTILNIEEGSSKSKFGLKD